jgi:hypothetical protein
MRIKIIAIFALVGFLIGFGIFYLSENFSAGAWMKLPRHPDKVAKLITANSPYIIETTDGDFYQHEKWQEPNWIKVEIPENPNYPIGFEQPCDFSSPEFSIFSNSPDDIVDCIQIETLAADGSISYTLALDAIGDIWASQITRTAYETVNKSLCLPSLGLLVGAGLGMVAASEIFKLQDKKAKT